MFDWTCQQEYVIQKAAKAFKPDIKTFGLHIVFFSSYELVLSHVKTYEKTWRNVFHCYYLIFSSHTNRDMKKLLSQHIIHVCAFEILQDKNNRFFHSILAVSYYKRSAHPTDSVVVF